MNRVEGAKAGVEMKEVVAEESVAVEAELEEAGVNGIGGREGGAEGETAVDEEGVRRRRREILRIRRWRCHRL